MHNLISLKEGTRKGKLIKKGKKIGAKVHPTMNHKVEKVDTSWQPNRQMKAGI